MNSWKTIWFQPRATIRRIVETEPKAYVHALAIFFGAANAMTRVRSVSGGFGLFADLARAAVVGGLFGLVALYVVGWLYRWIGSWFGGKATAAEVRAAFVWPNVTNLPVIGLWLVLLVVTAGHISEADAPKVAVGLMMVVGSVFGLWGSVLVCHTFGEVHGFSAWKSFAVILSLPLLFLLAAIVVPNVLRARGVANEAAAIGNLRAMVSGLEMFRSVKGGYPAHWQRDMYDMAEPDFGPPMFRQDLAWATPVGGYVYTHTPLPPGCAECSGYEVTAAPQALGKTGTRSFFVDQSGVIRHCRGSGADAADPPIPNTSGAAAQAPQC